MIWSRRSANGFSGAIATGKWDIVIIAQSSFNMIEDNPDLVRAKYQEELNALAQTENSAGMRLSRRQVKAAQQRKRSLKNRLNKLEDRHASEDIVYFDQLGVDCIFMDEVHSYKRNFFVTKMTRVKGLENAASQKAVFFVIEAESDPRKNGRKEYLHGNWNACHEPASGAVQHGSLRIAGEFVGVSCGYFRPFRFDFYPERNGDGIECRRTPQNGLAVL